MTIFFVGLFSSAALAATTWAAYVWIGCYRNSRPDRPE